MRLLLPFPDPGVSVQPVAIRHDHRWFDPSLTEGTTFYLWRFLTQMYNNMSVEFLPVIHPTLEEQHNPKKFAARVRSAIAEALGVAETEHALADFFLAKTAAKSGTDQFGEHRTALHPCTQHDLSDDFLRCCPVLLPVSQLQ